MPCYSTSCPQDDECMLLGLLELALDLLFQGFTRRCLGWQPVPAANPPRQLVVLVNAAGHRGEETGGLAEFRCIFFKMRVRLCSKSEFRAEDVQVGQLRRLLVYLLPHAVQLTLLLELVPRRPRYIAGQSNQLAHHLLQFLRTQLVDGEICGLAHHPFGLPTVRVRPHPAIVGEIPEGGVPHRIRTAHHYVHAVIFPRQVGVPFCRTAQAVLKDFRECQFHETRLFLKRS